MHVLVHVEEPEAEFLTRQQETAPDNVLNGQRYAFCKMQIG